MITPRNESEEQRRAAARAIQRAWKSRNNRALMSSDARWKDAAEHAKMKVDRDAAQDGKNHPRERWNRAVLYVSQLRNGNTVLNSGVQSKQYVQKNLETQHWLELVDGKHRYGSNLKVSIAYTCDASYSTCLTSGIINAGKQKIQRTISSDGASLIFFGFFLAELTVVECRLDYGQGKDLSLPECPREQLEKERIIYLSSEQRLNYLANIDREGKLRWARNNELVDTTAGRWKDSGNGGGIIPEDLTAQPRTEPHTSLPHVSSTSSLSMNSTVATHYVDPPRGHNPWSRIFHRYFTARGILNRLLRKTVRRNTWIWVTDRQYNLFIGIKDTGSFQHSSFLAGGLVTSAGLISVKMGLVHNLSPLSGHYRTSVGHFHQFLEKMEERGLDMQKARISKAEAALWGIEHIAKWKKKRSEISEKGKEKALEAGQELALKLPLVDNSWKREILEGRASKQRNAVSNASDIKD
ncbi:hypothetical protein E1B28_001026 [Marasmius oreades]|uniref:Uncharacterized protein n=1 Tax=Marasmius oreades TaxID=181124 RepID=A0A9P7V2M5_9AGAR|nr:uncharacterized protein E1B28_001026 [Marasmius oreades]KAG7099155.1 hypothetical protein E1B28_001026 [Marasmius oreades]